jgi:hypothetical protein
MPLLRFSTATLDGEEFVPWLASAGELAYAPTCRLRGITISSTPGSFLAYFAPARTYGGISGSAARIRIVRK